MALQLRSISSKRPQKQQASLFVLADLQLQSCSSHRRTKTHNLFQRRMPLTAGMIF